MKRFIAFICTMALLIIPQSNIFAEESDYEYKAELIKGLNLLHDVKINHDTFVYSMAGFLFEEPESMGSAEDIARQLGLIEYDEAYSAKKTLTLNEAVKYAVITLGYKVQAENYGGFPLGYRKVASDVNLTDGVIGDGNKKIKDESAVQLIYNMLEIEPLREYYEKGTSVYRTEPGTTLLGIARDIYRVQGIVTANEYTSIYKSVSGRNGYTEIDNEEYIDLSGAANDLLGRNVTAYVRIDEDRDDKEIIYVTERKNKNKILEIDAKDIYQVAPDFSVIEYLKDNDKTYKAKLDSVPRVIYNGVYYADYTVSDLSPDIGKLTLIDNNRDGKYDIIDVRDYKTVVVASVDVKKKLITNRYSFSGCLSSVDLDTDRTGIRYKIFDNSGNQVVFETITAGTVLSVALSKDNETYAEVYISGDAEIQGVVTEINNEENEIVIADNVYRLSQDFIKYLSETSREISFGREYIFLKDSFGNISYISTVAGDDYKLVLKIKCVDFIEEKYSLVYMDTNGDWFESPLAKKVKLDTTTRMMPIAVYESLGKFEPQIMKIKLNAAGEVKEIDRADVAATYKEDEFVKTAEGAHVFRASPNALSMRYYPNADAKLFVLPETVSYTKDDYYVTTAKGFFVGDTVYRFSVYDQDKFGFFSIGSVKQIPNTNNAGMFLVTGFSKTVIDDEICEVIKGTTGDYRNMTLVADNSSRFSGIKKGDIISVGMNNTGRVSVVNKLYSTTDTFAAIDVAEHYAVSLVLAGTVEDVDLSVGRFLVNLGGTSSFRLSGAIPMTTYSVGSNSYENGTASALKRGDKIVFRVSYGGVREIIRVEN